MFESLRRVPHLTAVRARVAHRGIIWPQRDQRDCLFTVCRWLTGSVRVTSVGEVTAVLRFRER